MSYIEQIAYHLNRRDEVPNQTLAKILAEKKDAKGIVEIASFLKDKNKSVASDCLKVLYEIGYISPELIVPYTDIFIDFLNHKNNRMVWGSMIGLSSVAKVAPEKVFPALDVILEKIETGSVITNVWGVYTVINLANHGYYSQLRDKLFELQQSCRSVDFPKRAEAMAPVIDSQDREAFSKLLIDRKPALSKAGQKRIEKVLKNIDYSQD